MAAQPAKLIFSKSSMSGDGVAPLDGSNSIERITCSLVIGSGYCHASAKCGWSLALTDLTTRGPAFSAPSSRKA
ncbi:MAG: hypothetical protein IT338_10970 [Thermomicrobiales bacterium]|nr:hypothetical protein [Thermomicrobiales bacterium]